MWDNNEEFMNMRVKLEILVKQNWRTKTQNKRQQSSRGTSEIWNGLQTVARDENDHHVAREEKSELPKK